MIFLLFVFSRKNFAIQIQEIQLLRSFSMQICPFGGYPGDDNVSKQKLSPRGTMSDRERKRKIRQRERERERNELIRKRVLLTWNYWLLNINREEIVGKKRADVG